jgi:LmbE family N-acetylglucosaminyl deacetylase
VLSPHFDDAVLSAAGQIMRNDGHAAVVTVCGGVPADDVPASEWDSLCGFRTGAEAAQVRAQEDVNACQLLDAESVHLSHLDGPYASTDDLGDLTDLIAALPPHTRVLVPAGIGGNPDHVRVRDCALAALAELPDRQVGVFADLPYAAALWHWGNHTPDSLLAGQAGLRVLAGLSARPLPARKDTDVVVEHIQLDDAQWQRKRGAVCAYASQLGPLGSHAFRFMANPGPLQHEVVWWLGASDATS